MVRYPLRVSYERGKKQRFDIIVREKVNKIRKPDVVLNRQPLRPANLREEFERLLADQWNHHSYGGKIEYRWFEVQDPVFDDYAYIFTHYEKSRTHSFSVSIRQV